MADGKVVIDTSLNNKGFTTGIRSMEGELGGLKNVLTGIGKTIAAVFAIHTIVNFGKQCIELGSNVTEVQNVVDVAFGDMAYKIENFANTSIQSYGMSRLAAKKTASTYMAMARGMGIASDKASDMAISLTGLTGDVASFFNITQEEADIKLRSVFTGETETLKDLGVVMTQTNLQAYAMSQGITKNVQDMSQAELVGLRYNFVLNQLALAHGDFARTSDSWANQTRILSMQWQEFMSIVGQTLTKILAPLVKMLNSIVASLISMANTFNSVISSLFGGANNQIQQTASSASGVSDAIGSGVDNQNALTDATKKTEKEQNKLLAGFDEINKLSAGSGSSGGSGSGSSGTGAGASGGASVPALSVDTAQTEGNQKALEFFQNLKTAIQPVADALGRLWDELKLVGSFTGDALEDFYNTFLVPVGSWVLGEGLPRFIDAITNGLAAVDWKKINDALHNLWTALAPFAVNVGEGLLWLWENVLVPLGTWVANNAVPAFLKILSSVITILNGVIEALQPLATWLWNSFLQPIASWTGGVIVSVLEGLATVLQKISDWVSQNGEAVRGTIEGIAVAFGLWEGIKFLNYVAYIGALTNTTGWIALFNAIQQLIFVGFNPLKEAIVGAAGVLKDLVVSLAGVVSHAALVTAELVKQAAQLAVSTAKWIANEAAMAAAKLQQLAVSVATAAYTAATTIATTATTAFSTALNFLAANPIVLVIAGVVALIAVVYELVTHWDMVKAAASTAWDTIKTAWEIASGWFSDNVATPISTLFSGLWSNVGTWASGAWTNITTAFANAEQWFKDHIFTPVKAGFKGFINDLIGFVESFVNLFVRGINRVIDAVDSMSFKVPFWVPGIGGSTWGFNIPSVSELRLPRLATGAVIPPNREFLAVLGDQKSGTNIEAPEALLRQIQQEGNSQIVSLLQALLSAVRSGKVIEINGRTFGEVVYDSYNSESKRVGIILG